VNHIDRFELVSMGGLDCLITKGPGARLMGSPRTPRKSKHFPACDAIERAGDALE